MTATPMTDLKWLILKRIRHAPRLMSKIDLLFQVRSVFRSLPEDHLTIALAQLQYEHLIDFDHRLDYLRFRITRAGLDLLIEHEQAARESTDQQRLF